MLTHIDVFLGVSMVMLGLSLLLTIVTQAVVALLNLRGRRLLGGLTELFNALHVDTDRSGLAKTILMHPLIADGLTRLAPAISKADLTRLLGEGERFLGLENSEAERLREVKERVAFWFDAAMSRVSHRFTLDTRIVTVVASTLLAFVLQLDVFGLVKNLYADSELRAKLAGATGAMVTTAQQVLTEPGLFAAAARKVAARDARLGAPPEHLVSREDAEAWLRKAAPADQADAVVATYRQSLADEMGPAAARWMSSAQQIDASLSGAGLRLIPQPYRPFSYETPWSFLGVIVGAALLSLGAPFWFNALKGLSNLKPAMAASVAVRDQGAR